jgi:hypothetical protein
LPNLIAGFYRHPAKLSSIPIHFCQSFGPAMSITRKKLPIGIASLSKIIAVDYYYADKTGLLAQLIAHGGCYFLSRPRRFGKSLLLDTLKEIFEGNQALFTHLAIHPQWDWTRRHPVLRIDFSGDTLAGVDDLTASVHQQLEEYERQFELPARYPDHRGCLLLTPAEN